MTSTDTTQGIHKPSMSQPDYDHITEEELITPTSGKRNRCYGGIIRRQSLKEQFLLVKGRRTGIWSFPKGHSVKGETPLECAIREIREETGLQLQEPIRAQRLKGGIYFVFHLTDQEETHHEDLGEIEETRWVSREEMEYLIVNSGVRDFLQRRM
jgi:8-oxo-dGTP pyrophosphatase MutT (NUDIX family)